MKMPGNDETIRCECGSDDIIHHYSGDIYAQICNNCGKDCTPVKESPQLAQVASLKVLNFVATALKLMHDNAWHYEEGYDESDMCKRNLKALKAAKVAEYCGKWEDESDAGTGVDNDKEES